MHDPIAIQRWSVARVLLTATVATVALGGAALLASNLETVGLLRLSLSSGGEDTLASRNLGRLLRDRLVASDTERRFAAMGATGRSPAQVENRRRGNRESAQR